MIGIYKIINPKGKIYIGQSINIEKRWEKYSYCEYMHENNKLYNSLRHHGYSNHIFQIIEECSEEDLNDKEIYWIEFYKSCCKKYPEYDGLNIELGGNKPPKRELGYKMTDDAKKRISEKAKIRHAEGRYIEAAKKRKKPIDNKIKKEKTAKKEKIHLTKEEINEKNKYWKGKKHTEETKRKMAESFWNSRNKEEYSRIQSERFKGRKSPMKGKKQSKKHCESLKKVHESLKKHIIQKDINNNFIKEWVGLITIKKELGFDPCSIRLVCKGKYKQYRGYKWEYKNKLI